MRCIREENSSSYNQYVTDAFSSLKASDAGLVLSPEPECDEGGQAMRSLIPHRF